MARASCHKGEHLLHDTLSPRISSLQEYPLFSESTLVHTQPCSKSSIFCTCVILSPGETLKILFYSTPVNSVLCSKSNIVYTIGSLVPICFNFFHFSSTSFFNFAFQIVFNLFPTFSPLLFSTLLKKINYLFYFC